MQPGVYLLIASLLLFAVWCRLTEVEPGCGLERNTKILDESHANFLAPSVLVHYMLEHASSYG